jgi:hypothetical protein
MGWRDLLQAGAERVTAPWVGGGSLRSRERTWTIEGRAPPEHGWYAFEVTARKARIRAPAEPLTEILREIVKGYLVGDRLVPDGVRVGPRIAEVAASSEAVHLVEPGLDRFVRVAAGRPFEGGPLVYVGQEFPLGPEDAVLQSFLDGFSSVEHVSGVAPALDAAFRVEVWRRQEAERRRREEAERRREQEARRQREQRRREIIHQLGDGQVRREMAAVDFGEAARAALAVAGADYLDHRPSMARGEMVVRFRLDRRRFECVCSQETLRVIDAGICLVDHATGERGDTRFTLESLPAVIRQAQQEDRLVVFRHVA